MKEAVGTMFIEDVVHDARALANFIKTALQGHRSRCRWWNRTATLPPPQAQPTVSILTTVVLTIANSQQCH